MLQCTCRSRCDLQLYRYLVIDRPFLLRIDRPTVFQVIFEVHTYIHDDARQKRDSPIRTTVKAESFRLSTGPTDQDAERGEGRTLLLS